MSVLQERRPPLRRSNRKILNGSRRLKSSNRNILDLSHHLSLRLNNQRAQEPNRRMKIRRMKNIQRSHQLCKSPNSIPKLRKLLTPTRTISMSQTQTKIQLILNRIVLNSSRKVEMSRRKKSKKILFQRSPHCSPNLLKLRSKMKKYLLDLKN